MQWIREKFGTAVVSSIIGLIAFVFIFFGIFSPKATRGLHEGAVAGKVNGDSISVQDFNRAYNRQVEFFRQLAGGNLTDDQIKAFRLRENVFQQLVRRKLMLQEAEKTGLMASDEEVKENIRNYPVFQKDGKFDVLTYRNVLEANGFTPASFERQIREDSSVQNWEEFFRRRVHVSDEETRREFMTSRDKRNIKYVLLTTESGRKGVDVKKEEVQKFLADPSKLNLAKSQFEANKETKYKGKTFEAVQDSIARDLIAGEKLPEIQKLNDQLADQVRAVLKADKSSDAKVNALLKPYGVEVHTTGMIGREGQFLPGVGEAKELMADAFAEKSPINPAQGGAAKKYQSPGWSLVAIVTEAQRPDPSKFESERADVSRQIAQRKQRELFDGWMKEVMAKAKIDANPAVVSDASGEGNEG